MRHASLFIDLGCDADLEDGIAIGGCLCFGIALLEGEPSAATARRLVGQPGGDARELEIKRHKIGLGYVDEQAK